MRRSFLPSVREDDQQHLIGQPSSSIFSGSHGRIPSHTRYFILESSKLNLFSLEPYEDPVTGLERITSSSNLQSRRRRVRLPLAEPIQQRRTSIAADHALSGKYESLDYEIVESELYRAEEKSKSFHVGILERLFIVFLEQHIQQVYKSMDCLFIHRNFYGNCGSIYRCDGFLQLENQIPFNY
jgi:hypothetical protein